jgi:hypothetical protein
MPVKFEEITAAFEFVNTGGDMGEFRAFVCKRTGTIHYQTDFQDIAELYDELPDDIDDGEKYVALPDKRELGLGKALVLDFAREFLPGDFDDVHYFFSKRGAYPKFKALLARRGAIDRWHSFEAKAAERALRDWCALHSIDIAG